MEQVHEVWFILQVETNKRSISKRFRKLGSFLRAVQNLADEDLLPSPRNLIAETAADDESN